MCRKTTYDEDALARLPDANSLALAETVLRAGVHQFPTSAYLLLVKAGFQTHLKGDQSVSCVALLGIDSAQQQKT